jgi:hypothetical protein
MKKFFRGVSKNKASMAISEKIQTREEEYWSLNSAFHL